MVGSRGMRIRGLGAAKAVAGLVMLGTLVACASQQPALPEPPSPPPPSAPAPSAPPPVDLAGRWRLSAAGGGGCYMTLGEAPGAVSGTIAPEGGCPGNFFTSRKWTFESGVLILRDHKGEPLARLSYAGGRFEGQDTGGGAISLTR
jgi:hypothetical protein